MRDRIQDRIRVAVAGAGMISEYHLRGWRKVPGVELVAVVDPDSTRAQARAREFGVPRQYHDVDAMLAAEDIDALDIASPRETHGPLLRTAVARGIAVLCQKPFMPSLAEAEALAVELAGGARVMVNQNFRFRPYFQMMSRWLQDGVLGELTGCTIACRSSGLLRDATGRYPYIERQPFVRTERRLMIEEVLIHRIDIARWLCGPLTLVAARTRRSCDELAGESEAALLFTTRVGGMPVVVDGNLASAGYAPAPAQDRVEIIGSRSRIMMDHDVLRLVGPEPQEIVYEHALVYQQSFDATIAHFVDCLRTGARFLTDPDDNLETLRLVEAAYLAAGVGS
jgi:predicted dehydrogenase